MAAGVPTRVTVVIALTRVSSDIPGSYGGAIVVEVTPMAGP